MLVQFLASVLIGIAAFYGAQKYERWRIAKNVHSYQKTTEDSVAKLRRHTQEFAVPEIIKVTDEIHVAIGYGIANSILIDAPEGLIIIDTLESMESAKKVYADFRKISEKPVKALIFTHNHADHISGAEAYLKDVKDRREVEVWAHESLMDIMRSRMEMLGPATFTRGMRQFGVLIPEGHENAGIGIRLDFSKKTTAGIVQPNRLLKDDELDVMIAGLKLRLLHIPGETDDQIGVYWPEKKAFFCADDFYKAFPNLYAIRGTPFRSLTKWTASLDKIRALQPELLIPSHTRPIAGAEHIFSLLTDYRDAVQLVHDQTVRFMNQDMHPEDIAAAVQLPPKLTEHPYLQEFYGTVPWSVKGVYSGYQGWFSGDPVDLNPHTPSEMASRLVKLGGGVEKVLQEAEIALEKKDPQWALYLASAVLRAQEKSTKATELKVKALFDLSKMQISANGYNFYLTTAYEALGKIQTKLPDKRRREGIYRATLPRLFYMMSLRFKASECFDLDRVVLFEFPDTGEEIKFHMRNGIMDLSGLFLRQPDVHVKVNATTWRELCSGERGAFMASATSELTASPGLLDLKQVMDCIEN